jgi:glycosyltransferase involved in cell wall biosynthesis
MNGSDTPRKRVLLLCPHPENVAPGQRLKYEQYFGYLRANGYDITVSPFQTLSLWKILYKKGNLLRKVLWVLYGYALRARDLLRMPFYDGVFVFLLVTPLGPPFFERLCRLFARKVIYDIDDLVFLNRTSAANRIIAPLKSSGKYFYMMKCADHVITCTPYLDEVVRRYNQRTTDISSTINTETYVPRAEYSMSGRKLVIGWSGSFSTSPYLKLLAGALKRLREQGVDFKLLVIGDATFELEGMDVEALPWVEATEVRDLSRIDIGLYPLPDEQWVYGKSGLKALQYMALGVPTVATALGANFRVIEDGVSGYLVRTEDEWVDRLSRLARDAELRRSIGRAARTRVEDRFSIKANRDTYLGIFREVYGA